MSATLFGEHCRNVCFVSGAGRNGKNRLLSWKCPSSKFGCWGTGSCGRDVGGWMMVGVEQSMWEFPLPVYMGVRCFAPSLKIIPDSSPQRPLSTHLKFHSAQVKSLHARSDLKAGAVPDVAPIWPVRLLFKIFYKLHLSMNDLWCRLTLEGTHEPVWTCACPRRVESGIGTELE